MGSCIKCNGSGVAADGRFCICTEGRFQRVMHEAKLKSELKRAEGLKEKHPPQPTQHPNARCSIPKQIKKRSLSEFEIGQWVKVKAFLYSVANHSIGFVLEYDKRDNTYHVCFTRFGRTGKTINKKRWVEGDDLVALEFKQEDDIGELINLALDLNDKDWFYELTNKSRRDKH